MDSEEVEVIASEAVEDKDEEDDANVDTPVDCFTCRKDPCRSCCCNMNNYWKLLIGFFVVSTYLFLGGLFFNLLERPNELLKIEMAQAEREEAVVTFEKQVANFTDMLVRLTNLTIEEATSITEVLSQGAKRVANTNQLLPVETDPIWDYASSVFFASTVITTIGYGTIAPATSGGRILFIFYALLGIPIALIFLTTIASIMSHWINIALKPFVKRFGNGALSSKAIGSICIALFGLLFFILIPAAIFYSFEKANDWTYLISVYYCFVTLTTVGFGDFVPGIAGSGFADSRVIVSLYKIITVAWLWIGLALVATLIAEIQGLLEAAGKQIHMWRISHKKKRLMKFKVRDGSKQELAAFHEGGLDKQPQSTETHPEEGESVSMSEPQVGEQSEQTAADAGASED